MPASQDDAAFGSTLRCHVSARSARNFVGKHGEHRVADTGDPRGPDEVVQGYVQVLRERCAELDKK